MFGFNLSRTFGNQLKQLIFQLSNSQSTHSGLPSKNEALWWAGPDSDRRPSARQADVLTRLDDRPTFSAALQVFGVRCIYGFCARFADQRSKNFRGERKISCRTTYFARIQGRTTRQLDASPQGFDESQVFAHESSNLKMLSPSLASNSGIQKKIKGSRIISAHGGSILA